MNRIRSVDFFRGITMFLLAGEASDLYEHFRHSDIPTIAAIGDMLEHHVWHGLHFWDLIQPFFMFVAGVSIPFAVANRVKKGDTDRQILLHAIKRSLLLLFFGWGLYFIPHNGEMVFRFQNVLAQLSFTYLIAFLIRNKSNSFQIGLSLLFLLIMDLAYRYFPVAGFDHPWVNFENMGAWANNHIEGVTKASTWASINAVTTTAHTIWGVLCGRVLMNQISDAEKMKKLFIAGLVCLASGYALDLLDITPIIKKIATSSFVLVSGGYAMLALLLCYYLIDVQKKLQHSSQFFIVVGSNSLFIYLFFSAGGVDLLNRIIHPFIVLLFKWTGNFSTDILTSVTIWATMWYLCYWLYQKKIFFKI